MSRFTKALLLLFFFSLCGAAFLVTHRIEERRPAPAAHDLFAVVNDQLAAFRAADFSGAYRKAATGVQQKFTLPQFEAMIRGRYGALSRATRVEFGLVKADGRNAAVQVYVFGRDGAMRTFLYNLTAEGAAWKILGVEEIGREREPRSLAGVHA